MLNKNDAYKYKPLDVSKDELRLLRILPSSTDADIRCTIEHSTLGAAALSYTAISYARYDLTLFPDEDRQTTELIQIEKRCIKIGSNLYAFLQHVRIDHPDIGPLWVDAICINQENVRERNGQVLRIKKIFQSAAKVVGWLGPEGGDSKKAIEFLQMIHKDCTRGQEIMWFKAFLSNNPATPQWRAMTRLLWRGWWSRIWTVQEVVLAGDLEIWCGSSSLSWDALEYSVQKFSEALDTVWSKHIQSLGGITIVRERVDSIARLAKLRSNRDKLTIMGVLSVVGGNDCADPRDKIYGLLGLFSDPKRYFPVPDYTMSVEAVYRRAFVAIGMQTGELDFLSLVQNRLDDSHSSTLPTWCPDSRASDFNIAARLNTSITLPAGSIPQFRAAANKTSAARCSRDTTQLSLPGIVIDIIDGVFPSGFDNSLILKYTAQPTRKTSAYGDIKNTFEAIWSTFVAGLNIASATKDYSSPANFGEIFAKLAVTAEKEHLLLCEQGREIAFEMNKPLKRPQFIDDDPSAPFNTWYKYNREAIIAGCTISSWAALFSDIQNKPPNYDPRDNLILTQGFSASWTHANSRRRMVTTDKGYIGMVPELARHGDIIAVMFGCRLPVVLRPKGKHFLFIGECYVHGLMFGESMDDLKRGVYKIVEFELH